jgi:hypothetical protein
LQNDMSQAEEVLLDHWALLALDNVELLGWLARVDRVLHQVFQRHVELHVLLLADELRVRTPVSPPRPLRIATHRRQKYIVSGSTHDIQQLHEVRVGLRREVEEAAAALQDLRQLLERVRLEVAHAGREHVEDLGKGA